MTHTTNRKPERSVNTDELVNDYLFIQAVIIHQDSFDFEHEQMELFGFID